MASPIKPSFSVDSGFYQAMKRRERICGDTFLQRRIKDEGRWIFVLSDGLGSGVKANVLSTLTATMALNYTSGFRDARKSAETIMRTLPVCSERKISYATFTILDIGPGGDVRIVNYDNPPPIFLRNGRRIDIPYSTVSGKVKSRPYALSLGSFLLETGDRIILCSDGVPQAGIGTAELPFGWGMEAAAEFAAKTAENAEDQRARSLSKAIVRAAIEKDGSRAHDDATCAVIHYRRSKELLIATGPPVDRVNDSRLSRIVSAFEGKKVICGGTTAKIVSRETARPLSFRNEGSYSSLPPESRMEGFDLITEGIITLHAVEELLKAGLDLDAVEGSPAKAIVELMLESDLIRFVVGTRINEAWQDPDLPNDIGLRRTIVNGIMGLLENVYQKETRLTFV